MPSSTKSQNLARSTVLIRGGAGGEPPGEPPAPPPLGIGLDSFPAQGATVYGTATLAVHLPDRLAIPGRAAPIDPAASAIAARADHTPETGGGISPEA
jgi:hypothetical protein